MMSIEEMIRMLEEEYGYEDVTFQDVNSGIIYYFDVAGNKEVQISLPWDDSLGYDYLVYERPIGEEDWIPVY